MYVFLLSLPSSLPKHVFMYTRLMINTFLEFQFLVFAFHSIRRRLLTFIHHFADSAIRFRVTSPTFFLVNKNIFYLINDSIGRLTLLFFCLITDTNIDCLRSSVFYVSMFVYRRACINNYLFICLTGNCLVRLRKSFKILNSALATK